MRITPSQIGSPALPVHPGSGSAWFDFGKGRRLDLSHAAHVKAQPQSPGIFNVEAAIPGSKNVMVGGVDLATKLRLDAALDALAAPHGIAPTATEPTLTLDVEDDDASPVADVPQESGPPASEPDGPLSDAAKAALAERDKDDTEDEPEAAPSTPQEESPPIVTPSTKAWDPLTGPLAKTGTETRKKQIARLRAMATTASIAWTRNDPAKVLRSKLVAAAASQVG